MRTNTAAAQRLDVSGAATPAPALVTCNPGPGAGRGGPLQAAWRFERDGQLAGIDAYALRDALRRRAAGWPLDRISMRMQGRSVVLSCRTPAATDWFLSHVGEVVEAMTEVAGCVLALEPHVLRPSCRSTPRHILYKLPRLVVNKGKPGSWGAWREQNLSDESRSELVDLLCQSLQAECAAWGTWPPQPSDLHLVSTGRPMVISPAVGPRGVARLGAAFIIKADIEGDLYLGHHTQQGHGWLQKCGAVQRQQGTDDPAADVETARQLLRNMSAALPTLADPSSIRGL